MTQQPRMRLSTVVLDAPDARELADFYRRLLGWEIKVDEGDWVLLERPDDGTSLSFQTEEFYVRPVWPGAAGEQLMMLHLDIEVDDLDEAGAHAVAQGASWRSSNRKTTCGFILTLQAIRSVCGS